MQTRRRNGSRRAVGKNLEEDELERGDILIIVCDAIRAPEQAAPIIEALNDLEISAHLAGVTTTVDELFSEGSIAISGIYRAKGHEAAMVYVAHSEYAAERGDQIKRRNTLLTAITRSRAWARVCGVGKGMDAIADEVNRVVADALPSGV